LQPEGVTVIEWAERWLGDSKGPKSNVPNQQHRLRLVRFEVLSETERRITYEDTDL
jgi:hypothetical protein